MKCEICENESQLVMGVSRTDKRQVCGLCGLFMHDSILNLITANHSNQPPNKEARAIRNRAKRKRKKK